MASHNDLPPIFPLAAHLRPGVIVQHVAVEIDAVRVLRQVPRRVHALKVDERPGDRLRKLRHPFKQPVVHVLQPRHVYEACAVRGSGVWLWWALKQAVVMTK